MALSRNLKFLFQHLLQEVVSDLDARGGIALHISQLAIQRRLVKETSHNITGIIEDNGDVDILRGLDDGRHVVSLVVELGRNAGDNC